jgi:hypothetical protein
MYVLSFFFFFFYLGAFLVPSFENEGHYCIHSSGVEIPEFCEHGDERLGSIKCREFLD